MEAIPGLADLAWMALVAAIAPIVVGLLPQPRPPEVVVMLVGGILLGPHVFDRVDSTHAVNLVVQIGLGFLFFVAGYELDLAILRQRPGRVAGVAWLVSLALGMAAALAAEIFDWVHSPFPVAIALTTTALGTLIPIIRDNGVMGTGLGRSVLASGALGEFGPLLAISLFLGTSGIAGALAALGIVGGVAALTVLLPPRMSDRIREIIDRGHATTSQTLLRWTVVLLLVLLAVASRFGLDIVIGAFAAGIVLRVHRDRDPEDRGHLADKLEGIAFGFFVPVFFVSSGVALDLPSLVAEPLRLVVFFVALLVIRGVPTYLLHREVMPQRADRVRLMFYTATGLPLIIAITSIGVSTEVMLPATATALVGAGVLSVLTFPLAAELVGRRQRRADAVVAPTS
jgi:Kef-type K+ transport system membrane component KefB